MFFSFFAELRGAKVPVSLREYLTLMEALQKRVAALIGSAKDSNTRWL